MSLGFLPLETMLCFGIVLIVIIGGLIAWAMTYK